MNAWGAVTMVTPEYEHLVPAWEEIVRGFGGVPTVIRRETTGRWDANCGLKPGALLEALWRTEFEWLLWIDADARLYEAPVVPAGLAWDVGIQTNPNPTHKNRVTAACLFVARTDNSLDFMIGWKERCRLAGGKDHPQLTKTLKNPLPGWRIVNADDWVEWRSNGLVHEAERLKPGRQAFDHRRGG